jgi:hypothetical protein
MTVTANVGPNERVILIYRYIASTGQLEVYLNGASLGATILDSRKGVSGERFQAATPQAVKCWASTGAVPRAIGYLTIENAQPPTPSGQWYSNSALHELVLAGSTSLNTIKSLFIYASLKWAIPLRSNLEM